MDTRMAEYIEKATLLNRVIIPSICSCVQGPTAERLKKFCIDTVNNVSAADVAPVVHGRWLNFYNDFSCAECDRCGTTFEVTDSESNEGLWNAFKLSYNHCPHCGAKMDEED